MPNRLINNYLPAYIALRHTDINSVKVDHIAYFEIETFGLLIPARTPIRRYSRAAGDGLPAGYHRRPRQL